MHLIFEASADFETLMSDTVEVFSSQMYTKFIVQ